jgi:hypothetical protein
MMAAGSALILPLAPVGGQATPPATDIHVAELRTVAGRLIVGEPANLTVRPGYDNQPAFTADGAAVWYTSIGPDGQADICRIELAPGARTCIAPSSESEYSPTPMPGGGISVVRVERDSTQRLWKLSETGEWSLVLRDVRPVGYHVWVDVDRVLVFLLGNPATLAIADRRNGSVRSVARNVGRSLHRIPGTASLSFPQRVDTLWWVTRVDPATLAVTPVAPALLGIQDHAWLPDGTLLQARGNRLYRWTPGLPGWELLRVFTEPGLATISRLAVSPRGDRLALVGQESAR